LVQDFLSDSKEIVSKLSFENFEHFLTYTSNALNSLLKSEIGIVLIISIILGSINLGYNFIIYIHDPLGDTHTKI